MSVRVECIGRRVFITAGADRFEIGPEDLAELYAALVRMREKAASEAA